MYKLFDVGNTGNIGQFVSAKDAQQALKVSKKLGHIKELDNGRVSDITDKKLNGEAGDSLDKILKKEIPAVLSMSIPTMSGDEFIEQLSEGKAPKAEGSATWQISKKVDL